MQINSTLGKICKKLQTGKTPPIKEKKYFDKGINWYTPKDLNKKLLKQSKRTISIAAYEDKKAIQFPKGTVLLSCIGDIGKVGITTDNKSSANQQITGLIPDLSKITTEYLYYWCKEHKPLLKSKAISVVIPILNNKRLRKIKISYEKDLIKQKKIAHLLTKVETLIEKRKKSIKLLDELLKSTFLDMFGDPKYNEKQWNIKKLNFIGTLKSGGTPPKHIKRYFKGTIPWITTISLGKRFIDTNDAIEYINEEAINNTSTKLIPSNSIMIGIRVGIGKISINNSGLCTNQDIVSIININKEVNNIYLMETIKFYQSIFNKQKRGATIQGIPLKVLKNIMIPIPPKPLQDKFANIVQKVEATKEKYQNSLTELNNLFNSLSQRAFRGELDLSKLELPKEELIQTEVETSTSHTKPLETKKDESIAKENLETHILDNIENMEHLFKTNFKYNDIKDRVFEMLEKKKIKQIFDRDTKKIKLVIN